MTTTIATTRAVDRLLDAVTAGRGAPEEVFAPDAELDATVPDWRFTRRGASAVAAQYSHWCADPARLEELERHPFDGGEVVAYLLTWTSAGVPFAAHHCHVLHVDERGRITSDRFFCGGRWSAGHLAKMAAASDAG